MGHHMDAGMGGGMAGPPDNDTRMWGMLCHAASLSAVVTGIGFILGPLIVWLIKKDEHPFIDECGRESLNFQISMLIYSFVLGLVGGILTIIFIGILILAIGFPILTLVWLVLVIIASIKANSGEVYRYPFTIRFF